MNVCQNTPYKLKSKPLLFFMTPCYGLNLTILQALGKLKCRGAKQQNACISSCYKIKKEASSQKGLICRMKVMLELPFIFQITGISTAFTGKIHFSV